MNKRMKCGECFRWLVNPLFPAVIMLCVFFNFMDVQSSEILISELKGGSIQLEAVYYYSLKNSFLEIACLCIATLTGATMYAQDYEENAVYMRVQRMGKKRYVYSRVFQTVSGSFLCGVFSYLFCLLALKIYYSIPLLPAEGQIISYSTSTLLLDGQGGLYIFSRMLQNGFYYMFYSLCTMLLSVFLPKKKVVIAFPMILWYFNQYIYPQLGDISGILEPSVIFSDSYSLAELMGVRDEVGLLCLFGMMMVFTVAVAFVFYIKLNRNGVFGGTEE